MRRPLVSWQPSVTIHRRRARCVARIRASTPVGVVPGVIKVLLHYRTRVKEDLREIADVELMGKTARTAEEQNHHGGGAKVVLRASLGCLERSPPTRRERHARMRACACVSVRACVVCESTAGEGNSWRKCTRRAVVVAK